MKLDEYLAIKRGTQTKPEKPRPKLILIKD